MIVGQFEFSASGQRTLMLHENPIPFRVKIHGGVSGLPEEQTVEY